MPWRRQLLRVGALAGKVTVEVTIFLRINALSKISFGKLVDTGALLADLYTFNLLPLHFKVHGSEALCLIQIGVYLGPRLFLKILQHFGEVEELVRAL